MTGWGRTPLPRREVPPSAVRDTARREPATQRTRAGPGWATDPQDATQGPGRPCIPAAEAAVTSRTRSAPSLALGEPDQVRRLEQFRAAHPEVVILLRGALPKAWVGSRKIERHTLRGLLDQLEQIFSPEALASQEGSPR